MKKIPEMSDPRCGWYLIAPEDAGDLLRSMGKNRPLRPGQVKKIAKAISSGLWSPNGESIVINHDGELLDGQHRLRACVTASLPVVAYVVYMGPHQTPDENVYDSIDTGVNRTGADRIAGEGAEHHKLAAAVCRLAIVYERSGMLIGAGADGRSDGRDIGTLTPRDIREFYRTHKREVDEAANAVTMYAHMLSGWAQPSLVAYVYSQASVHDTKKADAWLHGLATGEDLKSDSPVLKLRRRLQQESVNKQRLRTKHAAFLMVESWNDYASGRVRRGPLAYRADAPFPAIYGMKEDTSHKAKRKAKRNAKRKGENS